MKLDLVSLKSIKIPLNFGKRRSFLEHAEKIWKISIGVLVFLLASFLLFDAYVFFFQVRGSGFAGKNGSDAPSVRLFSENLLNQAKEILSKRDKARLGAGGNLPARNPFGSASLSVPENQEIQQ